MVMSGMAAVVLGGMGRFSGCGKTMARSVRAWGRRIKSRSRSGVEWTRNKSRKKVSSRRSGMGSNWVTMLSNVAAGWGMSIGEVIKSRTMTPCLKKASRYCSTSEYAGGFEV